MTITIGCPEMLDGKEGRRVLAAFYAELLGLRAFEPYGWLKLAKRPPDDDYVAGRTTDGGSKLQLALDGDGWSDQRPPRWPDPEYPQQMHLDILVLDVEAADKFVTGMGAALLADQGNFRTYGDPAGQPFCLYPDPATASEGPVAYPARLHVDYRFPDGLQAAMPRAARLGAIHLPVREVIYADPAGHPFCL